MKLRLAIIALAGAAFAQGAALAQTPERTPVPRPPDRLLDQDYLTSTGETVPKPGQPQSSGETPLDKSMQKRDDKIERSICSNC